MSENESGRRVIPGGLIALTACQVRAARAMLRWSVPELARRSGVSVATLRRIESVYGTPPVTVQTLDKLRLCFEEQGMTFLPDDGTKEGPGLRWGRYPGRVVEVPSGDASDAEGG